MVYSDNEIQKAITFGLLVISRKLLSFKNILVISSDHLVFPSEPKEKTNIILSTRFQNGHELNIELD